MSNFIKLEDKIINLDQVQYIKYECSSGYHYFKFVFNHSYLERLASNGYIEVRYEDTVSANKLLAKLEISDRLL